MSHLVYALLRKRIRCEAGFGMIELLLAMTVMSIGVLAVFAMFQSGIVQIERASTATTAGALADSEMENYRAVLYTTIGLNEADLDAADSTYTGDSSYRAKSSPLNGADSAVVLECGTPPCTANMPTKTITGADGRSYRVDTYMAWQTVVSSAGTAGRPVKLVTIVVRDPQDLAVYSRVSSSFDESTGL